MTTPRNLCEETTPLRLMRARIFPIIMDACDPACRVIIVRYILDEDAEDTEDADDDRSAFHSRTTMSV